MSRATDRAARHAAATGSGPTRDDAAGRARFPGAKSAFGLLGEVLVIGVLIAVVSVPIITLPAALAAGVRHLRRFLTADDSSLGWFWRDVRSALLGGTAIGAASVVVALVLVLDIDLAGSGALPGGPLIAVVGWAGLAALALALFTASGLWSPESGWLAALKAVPGALRADPAGAAYLLATAGFAGVVTWQLFPLVIPALGCIALAIVAVPERPRRGHGEADVEIERGDPRA
ncbi:hypothetical protein [Agromyces salentinus]|uniref:DUF624 domain-containing protein n=1 Tax=Agromyces salentinus TaxID=269421 RepID=A0ABN2MEU3_9MICO|nr:hypothetical protein [Agromyces salentinus]